ncbi:hypothetical protein [Galbitalea soli]|uniref:Uncharacterized protein n=1 Tax=Galbitalea soli TaxID=1268042 RepID=A0A7C9TQ87_9MICO|nr:hypothetical protein [Galbitalea soli]NEM90819.1 hypothetical protein [Galbitalea soli]
MRWDNLFDDLESQLDHELAADDIDVRAEEERLRLARLSLRDRVVRVQESGSGNRGAGNPGSGNSGPGSSRAAPLRIIARDGSRLTVIPANVGKDWIAGDLIDPADRRVPCLLPLDAIAGVSLAREQLADSLEFHPVTDRQRVSLADRLTFAFALRDLCRRRVTIELILEGERMHGTIDRVGRDHLDLAVHDAGVPRRESAVQDYRIVPFSRILLVTV